MKKLNTYLKFLETYYPLQDDVHHNIKYDVKVYQTNCPLGAPLHDPKKMTKLYGKCIRHIVYKEPRRIQEYLFYDIQIEQGMIMAYRPDSHQKGRWCLTIEMILPNKKLSEYSKHTKTKQVVMDHLISTSPYPKDALRYILEIAAKGGGLESAFENVQSGKWDTAVFTGDHDLEVTLEKSKVKSVSSKATHRTLKMVEV
jgi:hypothetical protein